LPREIIYSYGTPVSLRNDLISFQGGVQHNVVPSEMKLGE